MRSTRHAAAELTAELRAAARAWRARARGAARPARSTPTGVSQYGQTCQAGSSGRLQLVQAWRSFVVQTGQTRKSGSTSQPQTRAAQLGAAEPRLDRLDLELALAHVLEVLGRPEQHVDQRPEERRDRAEQRRERRPARGSSIRRRASLQTQKTVAQPEEHDEARSRRPRSTVQVAEWKKLWPSRRCSPLTRAPFRPASPRRTQARRRGRAGSTAKTKTLRRSRAPETVRVLAIER